jgi:predicted permease
MRPGFVFPGRTDVWVPPMVDLQITGSAFAPEVVARLAPDVTLDQARQVVAVYDQGRRAARGGQADDEALEIRPLGGELASRARPTLLLLAASAALLLLVVCASVANLLLARVAARGHELTVRRALGATRWRIARQLLIECLMLSATGAIAGTILAAWALQGLRVLAPATLDSISIAAIDARFAATAIGVTILTAVIFGVAPGVAATAAQAGHIVRAGRQDARSPVWRRVRSALIVGQMAVALVLLTASAAAVDALLEVTRIDPGFTGARALGMTVTLPYARFGKPATIADFFERAHERLVTVPGVRKIGATGFLPGSRETGMGLEFTVPGRPRAEGAPRFFVSYLSASPDYFGIMGIRLNAGRSFTAADRAGAPHVIVLSESAARGLFPDGSAVGRRVDVDPRFATFSGGYEVIGVVADVRLRSLEADERSLRQAYVSLLQSPPFGNLSFVAEVDGRPEDSIAAITTAMRDVDPSIPIYSAQAIDDVIDRYFAAHRLAGTLVSGFAMVTLLVAAIGLYGLMAQLVTERTREIGIRMALGAAPHTVRRGVVRHGIAHAVAGAAIGALGASAALRVFGAVMPGLETPDAWTFMLNAAVLLGAALAATWMPASRVIRVDPIAALRE